MNIKCLYKQAGATMILTAFFTLGLLAAVGMAIDSGHIMWSNARLQHAVDSATLAAAIKLNTPINQGDTAKATEAGEEAFNAFIAAPGNEELSGLLATDLQFTYSRNLSPFDPLSITALNKAAFVRGRFVSNPFNLNNFLIQVLPGANTTTPLTAVATAGIVGENCNVVPFVLCADFLPDDSLDDICSGDAADDTDGDGKIDCYGYNINERLNLVPACFKTGPNVSCADEDVGAGNYGLLNLDGLVGGKDIREVLSGEIINVCVQETLETKPGYTWGNVKQGILDRYNSDDVTEEFLELNGPAKDQYRNHTDYVTDGPRIMFTPIADCRGAKNGNATITYVGAGCVILADKDLGNGSNKQVNAEFFDFCPNQGAVNPENPVINGPAKVVLFSTEGSNDS